MRRHVSEDPLLRLREADLERLRQAHRTGAGRCARGAALRVSPAEDSRRASLRDEAL